MTHLCSLLRARQRYCDLLRSTRIDFEQCRAQCIGKRAKFTFALISPASGAQIGTIDTNMFYLPLLAPLSAQLWPKSVAECQEGIRLLQRSEAEQRVILWKKTCRKWEQTARCAHHKMCLLYLAESHRCSQFWRRRYMVAKGTQLITFNQITKKSHTCFDLAHAVSAGDCAAAISHSPPAFSERSRHQHRMSAGRLLATFLFSVVDSRRALDCAAPRQSALTHRHEQRQEEAKDQQHDQQRVTSARTFVSVHA